MSSRVKLQAPRDLLAIVEELGDADQILNVAAWETVNAENDRADAKPETVEEGDVLALYDRNVLTEAFNRKVFVFVFDEWSYIFDEHGAPIDDASNFTPGGRMPTNDKATDGSFVPEWREGYYALEAEPEARAEAAAATAAATAAAPAATETPAGAAAEASAEAPAEAPADMVDLTQDTQDDTSAAAAAAAATATAATATAATAPEETVQVQLHATRPTHPANE